MTKTLEERITNLTRKIDRTSAYIIRLEARVTKQSKTRARLQKRQEAVAVKAAS